MAMYPNATRGYMPFVSTPSGKRAVSKRATSVSGGDKSKQKSGEMKTYRVTLRDRQGFTYTYIIQADGTKSLPVLCDRKASSSGQHLLTNSLPNIRASGCRSPTAKRHGLAATNSSDSGKDDDSAKKGIFNSLLRFIRKKTKSGSKSKRKPKPLPQRKRQRTISAMSNLDPIQESPEEDNLEEEEEGEEDDESYTHDSTSDENESVDSVAGNEP